MTTSLSLEPTKQEFLGKSREEQHVTISGDVYFFCQNITPLFYPESKWEVLHECTQGQLKETWICFHHEFGILEMELEFPEIDPPIARVLKCYNNGLVKGEVLDLIENDNLAILYHSFDSSSLELRKGDVVCHETHGLCKVITPTSKDNRLTIQGLFNKQTHKVNTSDVTQILYLSRTTKSDIPVPLSHDKLPPLPLVTSLKAKLADTVILTEEPSSVSTGHPKNKATTTPLRKTGQKDVKKNEPCFRTSTSESSYVLTTETTSPHKQNGADIVVGQSGKTKENGDDRGSASTPKVLPSQKLAVNSKNPSNNPHNLEESNLVDVLKYLLSENRFTFVSNSIQNHLEDASSRSLLCKLITPFVSFYETYTGGIDVSQKINRKDPIINRLLLLLDNALVSLRVCETLTQEKVDAISQFPFAEVIQHASSETFSKSILNASSSLLGEILKGLFSGKLSSEEAVNTAKAYLVILNNPDLISKNLTSKEIDLNIRTTLNLL